LEGKRPQAGNLWSVAKARILVLEDDDSYRQFLCEALELGGHEPCPAANGPEAIAAATRAKFDLIVSDVRMAGMDGLDCLAHLKSTQPGMRRIVITGYASEEAPSRAVAVQAEDYLYKPLGLKAFLGSVERVLNAPREGSGYIQLLSNAVEGAKKLFLRDPSAEWQAIDARRELAFQSLYVGVRSHRLTEPEALGLWDHLEDQDEKRERLKAEVLDRQAGASLLEGYQYAIDLAAAMARSPLYSGQRRSTRGVPPEMFSRFYERVRAGEVTLPQVKLAPFLRSLAPHVLAASPPLVELHDQIWQSGLQSGMAAS